MGEPENGLNVAALAAARTYKAARRGFTSARRTVGAVESRVLGTKRRRLIAGGVIVALVVATIGTTVAVGVVDEQNRAAAAIVAQEKADLAEAAAEAKAVAAKKAAAAKALADSNALSAAVSDDAVAKSAAAAAWADPAVLAEVEAARLVMVEWDRKSDVGETHRAAIAVNVALDKIGTVEDSQDRSYNTARTAAGRVDTDATWAAGQGRAYCENLNKYHADDPAGATNNFVNEWGKSSADMQAIAVFCPQYQVAVDAAIRQVGEGKYSVGVEATPFGVSPRVIAAGTYRIESASDCYWARSTSSGDIIDNDFIGNAPGAVIVRINAGEGFETSGCRAWVKQ
jgi:hypothetical protein